MPGSSNIRTRALFLPDYAAALCHLSEKKGVRFEEALLSRKGRGELPGPKRARHERTDEWAKIKQWTLWPEQELYEAIRPLVLFQETEPGEMMLKSAAVAEATGLFKGYPSVFGVINVQGSMCRAITNILSVRSRFL